MKTIFTKEYDKFPITLARDSWISFLIFKPTKLSQIMKQDAYKVQKALVSQSTFLAIITYKMPTRRKYI